MEILSFFAQSGLGSAFRGEGYEILLTDAIRTECPKRSGVILLRDSQKL